ncbi:MAG: efflux RND transporter periplasmic adaptor subunit [Roseburia sp.]|nr:efflux RND transporter periplasmic adaptor subunit [Roseburia sp.]
MRKNKNIGVQQNEMTVLNDGKKKKKGKIALVIVLVVAALLIVGLKLMGSVVSQAAIPVTVTTASRGELQDVVSASGNIASENRMVIFSRVNGIIDKVNAQVGQEVKAGELLVSYQMKDAENALEQAALQQTRNTAAYQKALAGNADSQAKLNEANTNLGVLKQQISDCESYVEKLQEELSQSQRNTSNNLASQSFNLSSQIKALQKELAELAPDSKEYKAKSKELEEATEKLSQVEYQQQISGNSDYVAQTQQKIQKVQEQIAGFKEYEAEMKSQKATSEAQILDSYDKKQLEVDNALAGMSYEAAEEDLRLIQEGVTADFDGIITECVALPGAMATQGMQLLTLESSKDLMVEVTVSKNSLEKLAIGQKADIQISGKTYSGKVSRISRVAENNLTGTPMVKVQIHIEEPDSNIVLGLEAKVEVYTQKAEDALLVPIEVINVDRDGDFVYVVNNGVVERRSVVCGISADLYTEIIDGITEADQIVLSSVIEVYEGMTVMAMPEN